MASDIEHQLATRELGDENTTTDHPFKLRVPPILIWVVILLSFTASIAFSPLVGLLSMAFFSLPITELVSKELDTRDTCGDRNPRSGMYYGSRRRRRGDMNWMRRSSIRVLARVGISLVMWLALNVSIPSLKKLTLLGAPLWKWSLLAVTLTCAYVEALTIYLLPIFAVRPLLLLIGIKISRFFYFRMMYSMSFLIHFTIVLLSWLLYFRTNHGLKNQHTSAEALEYVTWTCVSVLVASILWLLKAFLLLHWIGYSVYRRFESRILITGIKYLFLGLLVDGFFEKHVITHNLNLQQYDRRSGSFTDYYTKSRKATKSQLEGISQILIALAAIVGSRKEDGIPYIAEWCNTKITDNDNICELDDLRNLFPSEEGKNAAHVLYNIVHDECSTDGFTFHYLKKWMVDAHKGCVNMGRTLDDAKAIVTSLDIFMSFIIGLVAALLWLLITGIATTKVLVTIATPLLALTFIFGDSAKTFFQGIIFCFVTHPFDVGDRCVLDESELEVKSIGILTTTFIKIGTKEKRMYPNSELATKAIVNLGWQPDPNDVVELTFDSSCIPTELLSLETKINEVSQSMWFFSDPKQKGCYEESHDVMIKGIGDKIMVTVHFTHVLGINEVTHSQCSEKKNKQRSKFLKQIILGHYVEKSTSAGLVDQNNI